MGAVSVQHATVPSSARFTIMPVSSHLRNKRQPLPSQASWPGLGLRRL